MAEIAFNIPLLNEAFPSTAGKQLFRLEPVNAAVGNAIDAISGNTYQPAIETEEAQELTSILGTPIFFPILFKGGRYDFYEDGEIVQKELGDLLLPPTTIAEFTRQKDINRSRPNGQRGTVKELWAFDDWQVTIKGLIIGENPSSFPKAQLEQLAQFEDCADSIEVVGDLFTLLGIDRLVIDRPRFSQVKGSPNVIAFQLNCSSDEDFEIIIE